MISEVKTIIKSLNIETSKTSKTSIKGCKNMSTKGINIKTDKFNTDEILIYCTKLDDKVIQNIVSLLSNYGYNSKVVPGIIIVSR
jgi:hypothetical protein